MRYENKEQYVQYKVSKSFKLGHMEQDNCSNPDHEGCKAVGSFVHREDGFTEYDSACTECLRSFESGLADEFDNAGKSEEGFYCEDCEAFTPYLVKNEDGSVEDGLLIHRDVEDRSMTDCCVSCYTKRVRRDEQFWCDED